MRISPIAKNVSFILVIILLSFSFAITWSLRHSNHAFGWVEFFAQQKAHFCDNISQPVFSYLANGDAAIVAVLEHNVRQNADRIGSIRADEGRYSTKCVTRSWWS